MTKSVMNRTRFIGVLLRKGRANWQFAQSSRKAASKESRQTASLPYPCGAIFILSGRRDRHDGSSVQNVGASYCRRRRLFLLNQVSVGPLSLALIVAFESSVGGVGGHFILRVGHSDPGMVISPGIVRADGSQHDKMAAAAQIAVPVAPANSDSQRDAFADLSPNLFQGQHAVRT